MTTLGDTHATQYGKRPKTARIITVLLCACFIAALVLSAAFIATHSHHEHDSNGVDGHCAACAHISAAENLLKTVSSAVAVSAVVIGAMFVALQTLKAMRLGIDDHTPASLKIRLNN